MQREKFACNCGCGYCNPHWRLWSKLEGLEEVCDNEDIELRISSGSRCPAHNAATPGAAPNSYHLCGRAADLVFLRADGIINIDFLPRCIQDILETFDGYANYGMYCHVDVRSEKRWRG